MVALAILATVILPLVWRVLRVVVDPDRVHVLGDVLHPRGPAPLAQINVLIDRVDVVVLRIGVLSELFVTDEADSWHG